MAKENGRNTSSLHRKDHSFRSEHDRRIYCWAGRACKLLEKTIPMTLRRPRGRFFNARRLIPKSCHNLTSSGISLNNDTMLELLSTFYLTHPLPQPCLPLQLSIFLLITVSAVSCSHIQTQQPVTYGFSNSGPWCFGCHFADFNRHVVSALPGYWPADHR